MTLFCRVKMSLWLTCLWKIKQPLVFHANFPNEDQPVSLFWSSETSINQHFYPPLQ
jgi:hypothetical protein